MKTLTKTINVYNYQDLLENEDLKQKVLDNWEFIPAWVDEAKESLKGFENSLPYSPENEDMTGLRLRTWIINNYLNDLEKGKLMYGIRLNGKMIKVLSTNSKTYRSKITKQISCPFTGYIADHWLLDPIMDFVKNPNDCDTWSDLIQYCKDNWVSELNKDLEYQQSEEYILELIESNGYEFDEDGNLL